MANPNLCAHHMNPVACPSCYTTVATPGVNAAGIPNGKIPERRGGLDPNSLKITPTVWPDHSKAAQPGAPAQKGAVVEPYTYKTQAGDYDEKGTWEPQGRPQLIDRLPKHPHRDYKPAK